MNTGKYIEMYSNDLKFKNYSVSTIENYCYQVSVFLSDFSNIAQKPTEISEKDIKKWLMKAQTINSRKHKLSALKAFYTLTIKQPLKFKHIEYPRFEQNTEQGKPTYLTLPHQTHKTND